MRTTDWENNRPLNLTLSVVILAAAVYGLLFTGCASGWLYEEKPRQGEAVVAVMASLGLPGVRPPSVFWHEPEDLNCATWSDISGHHQEFDLTRAQGANGWDSEGECVNGLHDRGSFLEGPPWIELAWAPPAPFHELALAHELGHFVSLRVTGDGDARHLGPLFASGGGVDRSNEALAALGL